MVHEVINNYSILLQETALLSLQQKFEQLQKEYLNLLHGTECEELLLGKGAFGGRIFRKRRFNQNFIVEKVESEFVCRKEEDDGKELTADKDQPENCMTLLSRHGVKY